MKSSHSQKTNFSGIQLLDIALFFWAIFFGNFILPLFSSDIDPEGILNPRNSNHSVLLGFIMLTSVSLLAISIIFSPSRPAKMFSENYMKKSKDQKRKENREALKALPLGFGAMMFTTYATLHVFGMSSNYGMISIWMVIILFVFVRSKQTIHQPIRKLRFYHKFIGNF